MKLMQGMKVGNNLEDYRRTYWRALDLNINEKPGLQRREALIWVRRPRFFYNCWQQAVEHTGSGGVLPGFRSQSPLTYFATQSESFALLILYWLTCKMRRLEQAGHFKVQNYLFIILIVRKWLAKTFSWKSVFSKYLKSWKQK